MSMQELMALKRMLYTTHDGHHHNWSIFVLGLRLLYNYLILINNRDTDCENSPRVGIVGDLANTCPPRNYLSEKKNDFEHARAQK